MPLLDERVAILNQIGTTLVERFDGSAHAWVASCDRALYAGGNGLLERLVADFPRYQDVSDHRGQPVRFYKLAQLAVWFLHAVFVRLGQPGIRGLGEMTAFADYIVPVALRVLGIFTYDPDLEERIARGVLIARDSDEEIELRAHTVYATARLTDEINTVRPADRQVIIPQIDFRLWKTYHTTFWPHHLTRTTMY